MTDNLNAVSLFSGLGGMDLGLIGGFSYLGNYYAENNVDIKYSMDFDKPTCDIFNKNFNHECHHQDITQLDERDVPAHDILLGGFPCQSFSVSAQNPPRLGFKDDRGKLFFEMSRILKYHQPRFFVAENVKGILSANKKQAFPLIISEFEKSGYFIKHQILNAAHFGVPQKRERVFIVGFREKIDHDNFVFPTGFPQIKIPLITVLDPEDTIEEKYYFSDRAVLGLKKTKNYKIMNKGRAQDINKPSNTVSAHLAKVSLNSTDPVLLLNDRYRMYTPREVARIQSFPDDFQLSCSKTQNYKALGNAVPPVVMWEFFQEIKKVISKSDRESDLLSDIDNYNST